MERVDTTEKKEISGKMRDEQDSSSETQGSVADSVETPSQKENEDPSQEEAPTLVARPVSGRPLVQIDLVQLELRLPNGPIERPEALQNGSSRSFAGPPPFKPRTFHFYPMICYDEEPSYIRSGAPGPNNRRVPQGEVEGQRNMRAQPRNNNRNNWVNNRQNRSDDGYLSGSESETVEVPDLEHGDMFLLDEELDVLREQKEVILPKHTPRPPRKVMSDDDFVEMKRQERLAREPAKERIFEDKHVKAPRSLNEELSVNEYENLTSKTRCRHSGNRRVNPKELHSTNQLFTDYFRAESERLIPGLRDQHDPEMHLSIEPTKEEPLGTSEPIAIPQMPYQIKLERYLKEREESQLNGETEECLPRMKPQLVDEDESPGIQFMRLRLIELARRSLMGYLADELPTVEECLDPEYYQNLTQRFMMDIVPEPLYYYFNEDDNFVFHMDV